ncbi:CPCC family cysteine-rich protein [Lysinibacillus sp. CNPSo 3705]|uniref:CPCC family cysteine-rich protein n=1 Tax=Lysinibacillus sp. CNPSo 3705 TaxID=3028148 RepID=UPI002363CA3F|nr:CPCC family cysteine-rich protein [Lysinibacillus sp. CNPSo 3705]MDD1503503.1 CPCC family cysteine-rich protein [Lysinibacillus sp. CNPSo 3705]
MEIKPYPCPCCGYFTIYDEYDICDVCYWQQDTIGLDKPDVATGPNRVSLHQAQKNYKEFGASQKRLLEFVRAPEEDELPENNLED